MWVDSSGHEKSLDDLFGSRFVHRRLRSLSAAAGATPPPPVPKNAYMVKPTSQDYVWLAAEPLGSLELGQEVGLNSESDVQLGDSTAMTIRNGEWVKVEMIKIEEASAYAEKRRSIFQIADVIEASGSLLERLIKASEKAAPPDGESFGWHELGCGVV